MMKWILSLLLALGTLLCLCACGAPAETEDAPAAEVTAESENTPEPEEPEETPEPEELLILSDTISMSVEAGAIEFVSFEAANEGLVDSKNVVLVQFTFTNFQDKPAESQDVFALKYFQNGVEVKESSWTHSNGGEHFDICSNYYLELLKDGSVTYGRPVMVKDSAPLTIVVEEVGNPDNYQAMEIDLSALSIPSELEEGEIEQLLSYIAPEGTIDMTTDDGSLQYLGYEPANAGLVDDANAIIVKFAFTNHQGMPTECQDVFQVKYYQNGVEVKASSWISSEGGNHYDICTNYFLEVLKDSSVALARPVPLEDNSPVTIIVEEVGNSDNYQSMELILES